MNFKSSFVHPMFDIELWKKIFPLDYLRQHDGMSLDGNIATSPVSVIGNLYVRENTNIPEEYSRSIPTDLFIPFLGEPRKPFLTKIGGIPFRPREVKWPEYCGNPLVFTAQFCFCDSIEIVSANLPGDLLLVFLDDKWPNHLHFEWYEIKRITFPIKGEEIPNKCLFRAAWKYEPICFGMERLRTVDYPDASDIFRQYTLDALAYHVDCFQITKIGGHPYVEPLKYSPFLSINPDYQLLCRIGSICPKPETDYPFTNRKKSFGLWEKEIDHYEISWGDAGGINIYINSENKIKWEFKAS